MAMDIQNPLAPRARPLGVAIIAILVAVQGVLTLVLAIVTLVFLFSGNVSAAFIPIFFFFAMLGLLTLALALGLWTLKRWAFWALVVIEILNFTSALIGLFSQNAYSLTNDILNLILPLAILLYLFADRYVRAAFRV